MRSTKKLLILLSALVAALALVTTGTGVLFAGASGSSITYYGCLKAGKLTLVGTTSPTATSCKSPGTVISWDSTGPQGPPGIDGTPGAPGAAGVSDVWTAHGTQGFGCFSCFNNAYIITSLNLPAGNYLVSAHLNVLANSSIAQASENCFLGYYQNGSPVSLDNSLQTGNIAGHDQTNVTETTTFSFGAPTSLDVICYEQFGNPVGTASLTAAAVTTLH